jgi:hypothetical protein
MKFFVALLALLSFTGICNAECLAQAQAANTFIKDYIKFNDGSFKTTENRDAWINRNEILTTKFKASYNKIIKDSMKYEWGLDSDPIFNAQDYPPEYETFSCDEKSNFIILKAVNGERYRILVKVTKSGRGWLIDGINYINIPTKIFNTWHNKW